MSVWITILPILILWVLALGVLVYFICYKKTINRKLRGEESGAHVPMASTETVWKVVAVIAVFVMYSSLSSKITNLQTSVRETHNAQQERSSQLKQKLDEIQQTMKSEASMISGAYYDFGKIDAKEHKAELTFFVSPKSYSAGTEVSVIFRGETIMLTNNGRGLFTGDTIVPIFDDVYEKCMICITEDGVTKTEVWENAPQGIQCFNCLPMLAFDGSMGSQSSKKSLRIDVEYEMFPLDADSFYDVKLYVKKNGTIIDEFDFFDGRVSIDQSYSLEKEEKGATIEFYIKGVDEYGYTHEKLEGAWDIGEGAGNEAYGTFVNYGYQIYAPDGTLLTQ